jgi:hypothetical protein
MIPLLFEWEVKHKERKKIMLTNVTNYVILTRAPFGNNLTYVFNISGVYAVLDPRYFYIVNSIFCYFYR